MLPVGATGPHAIFENQIFLGAGGQRLICEVHLSGWGPQRLKTWQVKIDSSGYSKGGSGVITPAIESCLGPTAPEHAKCAAAMDTASRCAVYRAGEGYFCEPGFQDKTRTDWIGYGADWVSGVDLSTPNYRFGATSVLLSDAAVDDGSSRYGGTLVFDVPVSATGTFVVGMVEPETFMFDNTVPTAERIPIDRLVPLVISIGAAEVPKNRYLELHPGNPGQQTAIRVRLESLYHPGPPVSTVMAVPDFSAFEGQIRWLGPPADYPERGLPPATFKAAELACEPFFADWGSLGTVYVFGDAVLPSSEYTAQQVLIDCQDDLGNEQCYSSPVTAKTARWGDVVEPFARSDIPAQPDMADVAAIVDAFRGVPTSPLKVHAQLSGRAAAPEIPVGFVDVTHCADAIRGVHYPLAGPLACP